MSMTNLWVRIASENFLLSDLDRIIWEKALEGLSVLSFVTLERFSNYVVSVKELVDIEGLPMLQALGAALPTLQIPRSTTYFDDIPEKKRTQPSQWRNRFEEAYRKRTPYLRKYTPSQSQLSKEDLLKAFERVKESIPDLYHPIVLAFIDSPTGWHAETSALAQLEWDSIEPLFDGLKREKVNLGTLTSQFYTDKEPEELLSEDEVDFLARLSKKPSTKPDGEGREFYENHRNELKENGKLKSIWDRFIFGTPLESDDFLAGLALSLERLFARNEDIANRRLEIHTDWRSNSDLEKINTDAGNYFAARYKGVDKICGHKVSWHVGKLFDYAKVVEEWRTRKKDKYTPNRSVAKSALQVKFSLKLFVDYPDGRSEEYPAQLIWKYNPNQIIAEFKNDWTRLSSKPFVFCSATREPTSAKGRQQIINLNDVRTLVPVFGKSRGSLVPTYKAERDLALHWEKNLQNARQQGLLSTQVCDAIEQYWARFKKTYSQAVQGFQELGLSDANLIHQATLWSDLIALICQEAKGDYSREKLLRPLLQIGSVTVAGEPSAEIIAPWHPLRLMAIAVKAQYVGRLIDRFLTAEEVRFGDTGRLYFRELSEDLEHPFYPEVALSWRETRPELLTYTDKCGDYTLHELPRVNENNSEETSENPTDAANCVSDLVKRYLALHPHESANLSVVLYNCDSARLPQTVVDKLGSLYEEEEEVCCQVVLMHQTTPKLSQLYQRIVESADTDVDAYNASESTRDFMARLRISISIEQAVPPNPQDGCPNDIVFSQDVISRHAKVRWFSEKAYVLPAEDLLPARYSRRRPGASDDMKSVVYLCCPVQTISGWNYLTAMTTFIEGDWDGNTEKRLLPARQLDFQDGKMRQIFDETHNLGNWVVNYDELLDRRQLLNQNVRVIRYKQLATQGRNLVISSKAPLGLLLSMVRSRLRSLNLGLTSNLERELAQRFIDEANDVSGDIVLRAAKRGRNASELIGVVLSRYLIRHEVGLDRNIGWYFLDDYSEWLGQKEEQIADILALSPSQDEDGNFTLMVLVSESKYIDYASLIGGKKNSAKQLRDTVIRIEDAIFGTPARFDRELWLSRLSDLLLDGVLFPANAPLALTDWRQAIRAGKCAIWIRGYSHVFVSGPLESPSCSEAIKLNGLENAYQEIFDTEQLKELILLYQQNLSPLPLRLTNLDFPDWQEVEYKTPISGKIVKEPKQIISATQTSTNSTKSKPSIINSTEVTATQEAINTLKNDTDIKEENVVNTALIRNWAYPALNNLLEVKQYYDSSTDLAWLKTVEVRCKAALQGFNLQAKLVSSSLTPNAALLRFQGSANLTVDQVIRKITEFKTTYGLSVISVQPQPGLVVLSIERPERKLVAIEEIWSRWTIKEGSNQELAIAIREDNGEIMFLSPQKNAPHTLIAGSTGSGKSVLMQNIILSIAATNRPSQAKIILVDPKLGVDYFALEGLPHLTHGIVDDQDQALDILKQLVDEMNDRYRRFRETRTSNLAAYNQKVPEGDRLPTIWVIHDEFAEWMMIEDYKQQVTSIVARLGVKARAAGIYLVFAAQRPDANVMPMQLRANLGNRLILRVDSEGTSEIALGEKGAERLLGKGHLLAKLEGESTLLFGQVPFVSEQFLNDFLGVIQEEH
ncbi:DNA translocase FtsK [Spirosoma sp. BT702]|uniref:DNA translocase FtsK n=2 Tax=Spirosoma profusum TaxID=2771354 RepID=A0A927AV32_9BACT|nr:DNA translocase FtsK [Spirosoma profusum]